MRLVVIGGLIAAATLVATGHADPSSGGRRGQLQVRQVVARNSPLPVEGAVPVVAIVRPGGSLVVKRRLVGAARPSATFSLAAGAYRLRSWQRICDGNCNYLDPPSDRCSRAFVLHRNQRLRATITVRYGSGCRIVFG